jgi:hypothetical protein
VAEGYASNGEATAGFIYAARINPEVVQPVNGCLLRAEPDLLIAGFVLCLASNQVLRSHLFTVIRVPCVRQDRVRRLFAVVKGLKHELAILCYKQRFLTGLDL